MKTLGFALTLLSFSAMAQSGSYNALTAGDTLYVAPAEAVFNVVNLTRDHSDVCTFGRTLLEDSVERSQRLKCASNPENTECKYIKDVVQKFTYGYLDHYGPAVHEYRFQVEQPSAELIKLAANDYRWPIQKVKLVSLKPAGNYHVGIKTKDSKNFFFKIRKEFSIKPEIGGSLEQGVDLVLGDRLTYCAFQEKAFEVSGSMHHTERVSIPRPAAEVDALYSYYLTVKEIWKVLDNKEYKNPVHKMLFIAAVLKDEAKKHKVEGLYTLSEHYEHLFQDYIEENEFSVYIKNYPSREDFAQNVHPDTKEELGFSIGLIAGEA